jgi:hypothetical protein
MPSSPVRHVALLAALVLPLLAPLCAEAQSFTQLTANSGVDRHPTWSADGQFVLFDSNRDGTWKIYRMGADGSNVTALTTDPAYGYIQPSVSADGQWVVFVRGEIDGNSGSIAWSQICKMPYPSGAVTTLTSFSTANLDEYPAFTPDGAWVYFDRRFDGDYHIYRVSAAGGTADLVLAQGQADTRPIFSDDGTLMAYSSRPSTSAPLNVWEAPTSNPTQRTQLTFESKNSGPTDYSPGATHLLLGSRRGTGRGDLYELERATNFLTRLTFDSDVYNFDMSVSSGFYRPFNTDQILFGSARVTGNREIWILDRTAAPVDPNALRVQEARGLPGGAPVTVTLDMTNDRVVRALQFELTDAPDQATVIAVDPVGRALSLQADFADDGAAQILAFPEAGGSVAVGGGDILELEVEISPLATLGDTIELNLGTILAVDAQGNGFTIPGVNGRIVVARRAGDINGDNQVDGADLIRLVDIILGRGPVPTAEELAAADCTGDTAIDILDVLCLQELLGPESALVTLPEVASVGQEPLRFELLEPVRAVAFTFAPGEALPAPLADLAPFRTRAWRTDDGGVSLLASDLGGGAWAVGSRAGLAVSAPPARLEAWGESGRALAVRLVDGRFVVGTAAAAPPVPAFSLAPNPFSDRTTISFAMPAGGVARIGVFDAAGRLVRSWVSAELEAGSREWSWDGRDDGGRAVAGGVYFAKVTIPGATTTLRMVRIDR